MLLIGTVYNIPIAFKIIELLIHQLWAIEQNELSFHYQQIKQNKYWNDRNPIPDQEKNTLFSREVTSFLSMV